MMNTAFKKIECPDKELIQSFTLPSTLQNCDLAFANMCSWQFLYDSEFAVIDDMLLIRFKIEDKKRTAYMMPMGNGDMKKAVEFLEEDSKRLGHPLCMLGITPESKSVLDRLFPQMFHYIPERDFFDYIYLRSDLVTLSGKKLQPKRNHVNKFNKLYDYEYLVISKDIVGECIELEEKWFNENQSADDLQELVEEHRSISFALTHGKELGLVGGAIRIGGRIVAFTYGSPINFNTFGVHVEKADTNYEGIYAVINKEFVSHLPEQYIYINREEDLGIEGLRKAKLSYQPAILLEKSAVMKRR